MPDANDPLASVGYLIAAAGATLIVLLGYGLLLASRLAAARARNRELRGWHANQDSR
jgi:hypothetical protein